MEESRTHDWLPFAYLLLTLTFPFMLYKNYLYFSFIRDHGGYLTVFTDSNAVVSSAGALVRALSLVSYTLCLVVCVLERRRKYLVTVTILFFAASGLDLLIGFRGKVFLLFITLWYLKNLKNGKKFRLLPLAMGVTVLSLLAVFVVGFRENKSAVILSPIEFIASQGVSLGVTEAAVEYRKVFQRHGTDYLVNGFETAYKPSGQFAEGELFDNDLSIFLNRDAFQLGFGTGSSYLAEAYLVGGVNLVAIVSLGIGLSLRMLHNLSFRSSGAVVLILLLPGLIYLPRTGLLEPLAAGTRGLLSALLIYSCLWSMRMIKHFIAGA
ncbi:MAG: O-antigen polysaccharide polymerase Wzy, partial [Candidatus Micrarchaeaceae archaeon]